MASMGERTRKFLIFSLQESLYALDLAQVAEVAEPPQLWPIPFAPAYYAGVMSFHGDIVAVMTLSMFLNLGEYRQPGKIVVLRHDDASLAFLVDAVIRIVAEDEVSFEAPPESAFAAQSLTFFEGTALQLDLAALICAAESDM